METNYILIGICILLTGFWYRMRKLLNRVSATIEPAFPLDRNAYEVVMQPKWLLYSFWLVCIGFLYIQYEFYLLFGFLGILYASLIFLFGPLITSIVIPLPTKRMTIELFLRVVNKRLQ